MKQSKIRNWLLAILAVVVLFISIQYIVFSVLSVRKVFVTANKSDNGNQIDLNAKDSAWLELFKEKNWLESRYKLAQTDSIYLSINLQDSTLRLEIKGVVLKTSSIVELDYDRFFNSLPANAYHYYFGHEASGVHMLASIDKVPLTVKKAPKDSIEFAAQSQITDTLATQPIHWMMTLDNGILIKIKGINTKESTNKSDNSFWQKQKLKEVKSELSKTLVFKVPDYNPVIEIIVDEADAKAIYRAIPDVPMVCVRL